MKYQPWFWCTIFPCRRRNGYFLRGMTAEGNILPGTFVSVKGGTDNSAGKTGTYWDCTGQIQVCGHPTCGSPRIVNKIISPK